MPPPTPACSGPGSTEVPPTVAEPADSDEIVAESPPPEAADARRAPCADGVPFWGYDATPEWARAVIQATPDGTHGDDDTEAVWSGSASPDESEHDLDSGMTGVTSGDVAVLSPDMFQGVADAVADGGHRGPRRDHDGHVDAAGPRSQLCQFDADIQSARKTVASARRPRRRSHEATHGSGQGSARDLTTSFVAAAAVGGHLAGRGANATRSAANHAPVGDGDDSDVGSSDSASSNVSSNVSGSDGDADCDRFSDDGDSDDNCVRGSRASAAVNEGDDYVRW